MSWDELPVAWPDDHLWRVRELVHRTRYAEEREFADCIDLGGEG